MRIAKLSTLTLVLAGLALAHPGVAFASDPIGWDGIITGPFDSFPSVYVEGLNPDVPVEDTRHYAANWFALPYTPSISYCIDRVEFIHGEATGTVTIQVRADQGGVPSTTVLTQGTHELAEQVGFQGADMPPAQLTAGTLYWIVLAPIFGSQGSIGAHGAGVEISYYYSADGVSWDGTAATEVWIARFYGDTCSLTERTNWGAVKRLFW